MPAPDAASRRELSQFERLLAELSARFINLPTAQIDGAIADALRRIAGLLGVDRCQLIRFAAAGDGAVVTHSGAADGVPTVPPKTVLDAFPWGIGRLRAGHALVLPRVGDLSRGR